MTAADLDLDRRELRMVEFLLEHPGCDYDVVYKELRESWDYREDDIRGVGMTSTLERLMDKGLIAGGFGIYDTLTLTPLVDILKEEGLVP